MNLKHMRHLLALADAGSFRSAARQLNLSQSAITKSIKALEEEFGVPLISRGSQGSDLTHLGRELVGHARVVCAEVDAASEKMRDLSQKSASRITLGTVATASVELLPESIRHFQSNHRETEIAVISGYNSSMIARLIEGSLDLVVGCEIDGRLPAGLRYERLFRSGYAVVMRRGHGLERARTFRELSEADWIVPTEMGNGDSPFFQEYRRLGLREPKIRITSDCPFFISKMIATSDAIGILRHWMVDDNVGALCASTVKLPGLSIKDHIGVFTKSRHPHQPLINELVRDFKERAARLGSVPSPIRALPAAGSLRLSVVRS
jgi:LysR family transcriptional regulator of abg operon